MILPVKSRGVWDFLLDRQNPLNVTKVICRQSLITMLVYTSIICYNIYLCDHLGSFDKHCLPGLADFGC